jgi:signal transduction histidine kinase
MDRNAWKSTASYCSLLAGAFLAAVAGSWFFGEPWDNAAYDEMFRRLPPNPWRTESALLVFDERTLDWLPGGMQGIRKPLARTLRLVAAAQPKAVAIDILLSHRTDPASDSDLAAAFRSVPNLILSSQLVGDGWEHPLPEFRSAATALGHVHAQPDARDAITRSIPLEEVHRRERLWALSLEAFRLSRKADIIESPSELEVGGTVIPASGERRLLRVRFIPPSVPEMRLPRVSVKQLLEHPSLASVFSGKVVFVGVTAQTEHDRLFSPYSRGAPMSGIEINADAFETLTSAQFLRDVDSIGVVLWALALVLAAGAAFRFLTSWAAYAVGAVILGMAFAAPYLALAHGRVLPFTTSMSAAWFGVTTAAAYYHFVIRRSLSRSEAERARYQQAMHFVTHEMRTPLSAIQGSSELISRYPLTEAKRKQIAELIHSESKRLARMVEIFLNVERLSAGQMELKQETISVKDIVHVCASRVQPLAERKHIQVAIEPVAPELQLGGDRELMEYACYNLLTNAVKYSPPHTAVTVRAGCERGQIRIAVQDQGIGMDHQEVKQIFRKFYRTKRAEESGEAGTGIGLSIVQQIVEQHGGTIEVVSQPGAGSCFTLVLPAASAARVFTAMEQR